jgi:hypothetical protein
MIRNPFSLEKAAPGILPPAAFVHPWTSWSTKRSRVWLFIAPSTMPP